MPWDAERGLESMAATSGTLDSVIPVRYTPTDDVGLVSTAGSEAATVISRARAAGLRVLPSISNFRDGEWDAELVARIVHDPRLRSAHVDAFVDEVVERGWDGIDIDYEALEVTDLPAFWPLHLRTGRGVA